MAFHQPTLPPPKPAAARDARPARPPLNTSRLVDDGQEWVLFSPSQYQPSPTLSTEHTSRTAGLSRLSDFGSLNTIGRTEPDEHELPDVAEDEDELDSLDDGLHAFREPTSHPSYRRLDQSGGSILPAHDGLGTFPATSAQVQEQLWNHERFNPRRKTHGHYRSASSVQRRLEALDEEAPEPALLDDTRLQRIQEWRFQQSKILLEEYSRTTAQPRLRQDSASDAAPSARASATPVDEGVELGGGDSFLERITRTVIRNLMGIDETILSVILGESLIDDGRRGLATVSEAMPASLPQQSREVAPAAPEWESHFLRRIARELGHLVQHLSTQPKPLPPPLEPAQMDYAGLPVTGPALPQRVERSPSAAHEGGEASAAFRPTLQHADRINDVDGNDARSPMVAELDYWEQTPDLSTVFSYLTRRFLHSRRTTVEHGPTNLATAPSPASLHRASVIQHHHPLVARSRAANERRRRTSIRLSQVGLRANTLPGSLKRAGTSCASWSTKRSKLDVSDGGSRNYWDIGGSLGSESLAFGGMGHWGEV